MSDLELSDLELSQELLIDDLAILSFPRGYRKRFLRETIV
jgi:hypothetical protein